MRERYVDGLRGFAAVAVMAEHFLGRISESIPRWLGYIGAYGHLGVAVFFVISGYVIAMNVGDRRISAGFLGRYALRRSLRLDPPYWVSIAATLLLAVAATRAGYAKEMPSPTEVFAHLIYAQDLLQMRPIVSVYWTLCLEIQFYLVLILFLWFTGPTFGMRFYVTGLLLFGLSLLDHSGLDLSVPGLFVPYWFCFFVGACAHWTLVGRLDKGVTITAIGVVCAGATLGHADWKLAAGLTAASLLVADRGRWLSSSALQFMGRISYSLYLFHAVVGWVAMSLALTVLSPPVALCLSVGVSTLVAWIVSITVERASIALSRKVALPAAPSAAQVEAART